MELYLPLRYCWPKSLIDLGCNCYPLDSCKVYQYRVIYSHFTGLTGFVYTSKLVDYFRRFMLSIQSIKLASIYYSIFCEALFNTHSKSAFEECSLLQIIIVRLALNSNYFVLHQHKIYPSKSDKSLPSPCSPCSSLQVQTTTMCISVSLSGFVVLGCMFAPKVHIIMFQPQKNVTSHRLNLNRISVSGAATTYASHGKLHAVTSFLK